MNLKHHPLQYVRLIEPPGAVSQYICTPVLTCSWVISPSRCLSCEVRLSSRLAAPVCLSVSYRVSLFPLGDIGLSIRLLSNSSSWRQQTIHRSYPQLIFILSECLGFNLIPVILGQPQRCADHKCLAVRLHLAMALSPVCTKHPKCAGNKFLNVRMLYFHV